MKDSSAKTMTNQERARKAVNERWHPTLPKSLHPGILIIAGQEIACDVLEDGRRILRHATFAKAMGKAKAKSEEVERANVLKIPVFVSANNLTPYLEPVISERGDQILYKGADGRRMIGYDASLLPEACKVYVRADDAGILQKQQKPIAQVCRAMLYGLASVGITALIDECTGYQEFRERDELQKILENYIAKELMPWTKKFPDEFFKQIYRIHGWEYLSTTNKRPQCIGNFINNYIYAKLPSGIKEELSKKNPYNENGNRKYRHHQFLTIDIGNDNLKKQIVQTITVMKLSKNLNQFKDFIEQIS